MKELIEKHTEEEGEIIAETIDAWENEERNIEAWQPKPTAEAGTK